MQLNPMSNPPNIPICYRYQDVFFPPWSMNRNFIYSAKNNGTFGPWFNKKPT